MTELSDGMRFWRLLNNFASPCDWAKWAGPATDVAKRVHFTEIADLKVSTTFLATNPDMSVKRRLIFETMILGDFCGNSFCRHCASWDEAAEMHAAGVKIAEAWEEEQRRRQTHQAPGTG